MLKLTVPRLGGSGGQLYIQTFEAKPNTEAPGRTLLHLIQGNTDIPVITTEWGCWMFQSRTESGDVEKWLDFHMNVFKQNIKIKKN